MENKPQNVFEKLDKQGEQIEDISQKLEGISINDLYALAKRLLSLKRQLSRQVTTATTTSLMQSTTEKPYLQLCRNCVQ